MKFEDGSKLRLSIWKRTGFIIQEGLGNFTGWSIITEMKLKIIYIGMNKSFTYKMEADWRQLRKRVLVILGCSCLRV